MTKVTMSSVRGNGIIKIISVKHEIGRRNQNAPNIYLL